MSATLKTLLERASRFLAERGVDNPNLDAELLLADVLGLERGRLYVDRDRMLGGSESARFEEGIRRRGGREPLQQIRGRQEFFSREFEVDATVLIPRAETETLVEAAIARARGIAAPRILDVGTGSGAIAITLALELPKARVFATDVSPAAVDVGRANARRLAAAVEFRRGDLVAPFAGERFDLIVSNPPYVPSGEIAALAPEVRDHEPRAALDGGVDGLGIYRSLAGSVGGALERDGGIVLEVGFGQSAAVGALFAAAGYRIARIDR
ncbi:MAG TPA: peptide chain release factor N(5)-glutamine methyltransferase, partial [Candidatus Binatia bacterium]|nr:peptide chain release factor N(5)-glutamine methyltransferase [Candidatus Binatia bacterium]